MKVNVNLYSTIPGEIQKFLNLMYQKEIILDNSLKWRHDYDNPTELTDIIGTFIGNNYKYKINMWISLDKGVYINVTEHNADKIIRYIFERFP